MQALALAEGLSGSPAKAQTRIIRRAPDGTRTEIPIKLGRIMDGKSQDVEMAANDILFIPESASKQALKRSIDAAISTTTGLIIWRR